MPPAIRTRSQAAPRIGARSHRLEHALSLLTLVTGLAALTAGLFDGAHFVASVVGAAGFALGLFSQLVSVTTGDRWRNVIGMGACFVGVALGLGHGGFGL